jgi:hypothetical protein
MDKPHVAKKALLTTAALVAIAGPIVTTLAVLHHGCAGHGRTIAGSCHQRPIAGWYVLY